MMRVLIVEDDRFFFELIRTFLENYDVEVCNAENAAVAMQLLDKNNFDLITVDNGLPDIEGHELIRQMRERDNTVKLMMLTGTYTEELERLSQKNGADVFTVKDINMHFLDDIKKMLGCI